MDIYETVKNQVKHSSITYSILSLDESLEIDDIINDVFLKVYDKNQDFLFRKIKQTLLNMYRDIKRHKLSYSDFEIDIEELDLYKEDSKEHMIITNIILENIKKQDEVIFKCLFEYFINNLTYREIGKKYNISFNTVKNKINKGLQIIKDQM